MRAILRLQYVIKDFFMTETIDMIIELVKKSILKNEKMYLR